MTRRFKTEPASAVELMELCELARSIGKDFAWYAGRCSNNSHAKQRQCGERMVRLLLHWWGVGHNPARNVTTCRECGGDGREAVFGDRCPTCKRARPLLVSHCFHCNGTGKEVKL